MWDISLVPCALSIIGQVRLQSHSTLGKAPGASFVQPVTRQVVHLSLCFGFLIHKMGILISTF